MNIRPRAALGREIGSEVTAVRQHGARRGQHPRSATLPVQLEDSD